MLRSELDARLAAGGMTLEDGIRAEGRDQATSQAFMSSLFGSLHLISTFDWTRILRERQPGRTDPPAGSGGCLQPHGLHSRDRYRHAVEELAEPTGEAQLRVALKAVERARQVAERTPGERSAHIGFYLIGGGRRQFERGIGWTPSLRLRIRRLFFRHATSGYLGTIALGTAGLVSYRAHTCLPMRTAARGSMLIWLALLAVVPASELTIQIVQRIVSDMIPPRRLPRLELSSIPDDARTMVIVPTILDSVERARGLIEHLEVQALGNHDPNLHFALLTDLRDAATETLPRDAEILDAARSGIEALNRKHSDGRGSRFFLFHRTRQWNRQEGLWMGWERKRGKIEEFNRLLRGATDTSFIAYVGDVAPSCRTIRCASRSTATHGCPGTRHVN